MLPRPQPRQVVLGQDFQPQKKLKLVEWSSGNIPESEASRNKFFPTPISQIFFIPFLTHSLILWDINSLPKTPSHLEDQKGQCALLFHCISTLKGQCPSLLHCNSTLKGQCPSLSHYISTLKESCMSFIITLYLYSEGAMSRVIALYLSLLWGISDLLSISLKLESALSKEMDWSFWLVDLGERTRWYLSYVWLCEPVHICLILHI